MRVDYNQLRKNLERWVGDHSIVSYRNNDFLVMFSEPDPNTPPSEYVYPSQRVKGADIYIWRTIPDRFKRPMIGHEMVEFDIMHQLYGDDLGMPCDMAEYKRRKETAHIIASSVDERLAREILDARGLQEYIALKHQLILAANRTNTENTLRESIKD